jgi:hypothetical protein
MECTMAMDTTTTATLSFLYTPYFGPSFLLYPAMT